MNAKTSKLIRAYVNQIRAEGDGIILKDFKRRYTTLPQAERSQVKAAMSKYLADMRAYDPDAPTPAQLRWQGKARLTPMGVKMRFKNPVMQLIGRLMGIAG